MTLVNMLHVLLGAGLVAFGVLAHAAAQVMLRNARNAQPVEPRRPRAPASRLIPVYPAAEPTPAMRPSRPAARRQPIEVVVDAELVETPRVLPPRKPTRAVAPDPGSAMAADVTAALVAAGYPKGVARDAAAACNETERASLETWMRAALRRCARPTA